MKNHKDKLPLPPTEAMPRPGDFPLSSIESRAAARRKYEHSLKGRVRTTYLLIGLHKPNNPRKNAQIGEWFEHPDGSLTRNVVAPSEMSEEDALEIFGTRNNPLRGQMGLYGIHH
jgi:hypothetical protein